MTYEKEFYKMHVLSDSDIQNAYKIHHAISDVKLVLDDFRNDKLVEANRIVLPASDSSSMLYMPCISTEQKVSIIKTVSIFPENADLPTTQGNILVSNLNDGRHIASLEASYLTRLRTGAMTAIATDKLAREDSKTLGVIGTGRMAFEQVLGVLEVRSIKKILLFNRTESKAETFKEDLKDFGVNIDVEVMSDIGNLVVESDILNCATQSKAPVFDGSKLQKGTHINGVGSFTPEMIEMDMETIKSADQIYLDDMNGAKEEAGEIIKAVQEGIISWEDIKGTLADIFDKNHLRNSDDEITLYKCVGAGYFDLAVANGVMKIKDLK
ncbi:ornithine cyclodeaminase family protein [Salinicoccus sp. Marseille-QA3877]